MDVAGDDEDDDYGYPPIKVPATLPAFVYQRRCRTCGRPFNVYVGQDADDNCCGDECAAIAYDLDAEMIDVPWWFQ